jgi:tetratricopeptide (TPR) repeat protein
MPEQEFPLQNARGQGIAQAYGPNSTAAVTITGITPGQLQDALRAAGEAQQATITSLSTQLNTNQEAVRGFFIILDASDVPLEKLLPTLAEIAQRHRDMLQRLSALDPEDPATKALIEEARTLLARAQSADAYDRADKLLADAEASDMQAIRAAEAFEREAQEAASGKRRSAAATRAERGELSLTRLDYLQAGQHFKVAADFVAHDTAELRADYLNRYAEALQQYGDYRGDNAVLAQAIGVYRTTLLEVRPDKLPLPWAETRNRLGIALAKLGERESGTARLEEALCLILSSRKFYCDAGLFYYESYFEERLISVRKLIAQRAA